MKYIYSIYFSCLLRSLELKEGLYRVPCPHTFYLISVESGVCSLYRVLSCFPIPHGPHIYCSCLGPNAMVVPDHQQGPREFGD